MPKADSSNPNGGPSFQGPRYRPNWLGAIVCFIIATYLTAALISYEALWHRGREVNMPPDTQCRLRLNYPLTVHIPW